MTLTLGCHIWMLVLCMLCTYHVTKAGFERYCSTDRRHFTPRGICGPSLSTALSTVCRIYNKRGVPDDHLISPSIRSTDEGEVSLKNEDSFDGDSLHGDSLSGHLFIPRQDALMMLKRNMKLGGTITCECCIHQCTFNELTDYCKEPNPNLTMGKRGYHSRSRHNRNRNGIKEHLDLVEKARIGQQILHHGPSYWTDMDKHSTGKVSESELSPESLQVSYDNYSPFE